MATSPYPVNPETGEILLCAGDINETSGTAPFQIEWVGFTDDPKLPPLAETQELQL